MAMNDAMQVLSKCEGKRGVIVDRSSTKIITFFQVSTVFGAGALVEDTAEILNQSKSTHIKLKVDF